MRAGWESALAKFAKETASGWKSERLGVGMYLIYQILDIKQMEKRGGRKNDKIVM